jgi:pimeloyl-ACP methyl ester carboxylesterase
MLVQFLLAAATLSPVPQASKEYLTTGKQTVLDVVAHKEEISYKIRTPDEGLVSTFCKKYIFNQLLVWSKNKNGAFGYHISCTKSLRKNRKLVIWIHGGPWAWASKDLVLEQLAFLDAGYDLFIPLYPGSSDRPIKFEGTQMVPDVVDALREVEAALGWGRRRYELVDVAGESFGAFLAASLAPKLGAKGSLYLMSPNLGGQNFLARQYASKGENLGMAGVSKDKVQAEAKRLNEAYFRRLEGYAPLRLLQATKGLKLKLVYSGRDNLLIPEEIQSLKRLAMPGCGVDYRPDDGHEFAYTKEQYDTFRKMIRCAPTSSPVSRTASKR